MYATCLFCSAPLGTNEAIETFPVGKRVAFDAARGRLWAVCGRCGRWNLAPLEERWEPVEQAERLFTDTRARVHSENIGLARLADGTRLIRVGSALAGELAAWRYGGQLVSRHRRNMAVSGTIIVGGAALAAGMPLIASAGVPIMLLNAGFQLGSVLHMQRQQNRVVHKVPAAESATGRDLVIRRWHLHDAALGLGEGGDLVVNMPPITRDRPRVRALGRSPARTFQLAGAAAERVIARSLTDYNQRGGSKAQVADALRAIEVAGGAHEFARKAAASGAVIARTSQLRANRHGTTYSLRQVLGTFRNERLPVVKYRSPFTDASRPVLSRSVALALEMALQEQAEREALEGELAALEAAWREAEEIAQIADSLPD